MHWTRYTVALLIFNLLGFLVVFALQRLQGDLPFNPDGMAGTTADLARSTPPISFITNTNWQSVRRRDRR
jgi:K+-transporting ATPase ATPase A chain